jgi:hypothetical protein
MTGTGVLLALIVMTRFEVPVKVPLVLFVTDTEPVPLVTVATGFSCPVFTVKENGTDVPDVYVYDVWVIVIPVPTWKVAVYVEGGLGFVSPPPPPPPQEICGAISPKIRAKRKRILRTMAIGPSSREKCRL